MTLTTKKAVVDGLLTTYYQSGKGPVVLMLHGWGDKAETYKALAEELAGKYTVLMPDLPGFGQTEAPKQAWTLDSYAQFCEDFLTKVGHTDIYGLVGHSNGGSIAIRGIATKRLEPSRLVLLASAGIRDSYSGRNKALRLVAKAGKLVTAPLPESARKKIKRRVYNAVGSDMLVAEHLQETFKKIVIDDVQLDAKAIKVPTLLVYGRDDTATPTTYGKRFAELIAGSRLEILPGTHFIHHEQAGAVTRLTKEFLS